MLHERTCAQLSHVLHELLKHVSRDTSVPVLQLLLEGCRGAAHGGGPRQLTQWLPLLAQMLELGRCAGFVVPCKALRHQIPTYACSPCCDTFSAECCVVLFES